MSTTQIQKSTKICPSCSSKTGMQNQSFCSDCGYYPAARKRFEGEEEQLSGPSMLGSLVVIAGMFLLGVVGLFGRVYLWESGDHHYWMRYLLIIGAATFALGHLSAFGYSLTKSGLDLADLFVAPKNVWGPVLFDMHKKWIVASLGVYGLTIMLVGGVLFGVTYENHLSKNSNKSIWALIEDIQTALGKEPTEMPEISLANLNVDVDLPTGGNGKLVIDTDLSVLDPNNLMALAEVLDTGNGSKPVGKGSFEELGESIDLSALAGSQPSTQTGETGSGLGSAATTSDIGLSSSAAIPTSMTPLSAKTLASSTSPSTETKLAVLQKPLKWNQLQCFIFGYTLNAEGDLDNLVLGTLVNDEPRYAGLLPTQLIKPDQLQEIPLDFIQWTTENPAVKCFVKATWLEPRVICVIEHQGQDDRDEYRVNRFIRFVEVLE